MKFTPRLFWRVPSLLLLHLACGAFALQTDKPLTRAERTDYRETSHYEDVLQFPSDLQSGSANLRLASIGTSDEGRRIPLAIVSKPLVATPIEARRNGKLVVYIQANIHGGEVEGKEASLMLLRELCRTDRLHLLDKMVLLVAPIYNIDGNERWGEGKRNRGSQDGPDIVGERTNGKGLDLNRDGVKAESPEMRGALKQIYNAWDPDLMMDLHTTNGTRHGYQLTYAPPLHPNTEAGILSFARDQLLPSVRKRLNKQHGLKLQDYGNVEGPPENRAWRTVAPEPRYLTNYVGLRNRIAILSEAASFLPFKQRVEVTLQFVEAVLQETAKHADVVKRLTREADARVTLWGLRPEGAPTVGVRYEMASRGVEPIPLEKLVPGMEIDHRKAPTALQIVNLLVYDRFRATRTTPFPSAYLLPPSQAPAVELLRRHGIMVERLTSPWKGKAEEFEITESVSSPPFQGHRLVRLEGQYKRIDADAPAGAYLVRTSQPLGNLICQLLEPESLDGLAAWGLLEGEMRSGQKYPILKIMNRVNAPTIIQ